MLQSTHYYNADYKRRATFSSFSDGIHSKLKVESVNTYVYNVRVGNGFKVVYCFLT